MRQRRQLLYVPGVDPCNIVLQRNFEVQLRIRLDWANLLRALVWAGFDVCMVCFELPEALQGFGKRGRGVKLCMHMRFLGLVLIDLR